MHHLAEALVDYDVIVFNSGWWDLKPWNASVRLRRAGAMSSWSAMPPSLAIQRVLTDLQCFTYTFVLNNHIVGFGRS